MLLSAFQESACQESMRLSLAERERKTHFCLFNMKTAVHLSGVTSAVVPFLLQFWFHVFENYPVKSRWKPITRRVC